MKRKRQRIFIQIAVVVIAAATTTVFVAVISRFVAIRHSTHFNRTGSVVTLCACTNVLLSLCVRFVDWIFAYESKKHTLTSLWQSVILHVERHSQIPFEYHTSLAVLAR